LKEMKYGSKKWAGWLQTNNSAARHASVKLRRLRITAAQRASGAERYWKYLKLQEERK
jgi:hypothetical protein